MERHQRVERVQRAACIAVRNMVARSPELRLPLLDEGAERLIQSALINHEYCKDVASAALRDLGVSYDAEKLRVHAGVAGMTA